LSRKSKQFQVRRQYICAACGGALVRNGQPGGLGTWRCPKHPNRVVKVKRDTSGGSEQNKGARETPVAVVRHTAVKVILTQEGA
jgi:hypothetical protein